MKGFDKILGMRFFLLILFAFGSIQGMTRSAAPPTQVESHIGVRTLQYQDKKRDRPVLVELWYPTAKSDPVALPDANDALWVHPKEIRNVPIADPNKKYPLIILSHGHGGDRRNLSWLAEYLVQNGFIVASVEHHGNSWRSYNPLISLRFWERARDVSFAIQQLLKDQNVKNQIDANRIGFVGYSLGGMTGLSLAGAKAQNVKEIITQQQLKYKELEPEYVQQVDFTDAHSDFAEPRIKAMVLISPATFIFPPQSLKNLKIPVALVATEGDEILPFQDHAKKLIEHLVPAKLKLFRHHSHYVFLNRISDSGKTVIQKEVQADSIDSERAAVHKEVGEFTTQFFKDTLK